MNVVRLHNGLGLDLPTQQNPGDAGFDLQCADDEVWMFPGDRKMIATGFAWQIPDGFVGLVCPRSGLASKTGITVANSPGIVNSSYRGEVKVILINHGISRQVIRRMDRIAQMIIAPVMTNAQLVEVEALGETERGAGGFGSTGA